MRPAGFEPATRGLEVRGGYLPLRVVSCRQVPYLQVFYGLEQVSMCHHILLNVGPVVVKIVVNWCLSVRVLALTTCTDHSYRKVPPYC